MSINILTGIQKANSQEERELLSKRRRTNEENPSQSNRQTIGLREIENPIDVNCSTITLAASAPLQANSSWPPLRDVIIQRIFSLIIQAAPQNSAANSKLSLKKRFEILMKGIKTEASENDKYRAIQNLASLAEKGYQLSMRF